MRRDSEHRDPVRSIWVYCRRRGRTCIHSERQQVTRRIEEYPTGQNVKALRHGHIFRHCSKHWHSPRGGQQICRRATERLVSVRSEHTSWLQRSQHRWNWERQDNIGENDSECVAALLSQNVDLQCAHWIPGHGSLPENIGWCFSIWWWDYVIDKTVERKTRPWRFVQGASLNAVSNGWAIFRLRVVLTAEVRWIRA